MERLLADVRHAVRSWLNDPIVAAAALVTLVLGIGANTAIFSVVDAVLFRALPYQDPARIVRVTGVDPRDPDAGLRYEHFQALQRSAQSFDALAVYYRNTGWSRVALTSGEPESVQAAFASASLFRVLGVAPILGRPFTDDEERGRARVVVLNDRLWKRRFGGTRDAIGKTIDIDGEPFAIVGVMPATFQFPARDSQLWAPMTTNRYWPERLVSDPGRHPNFFRRWNVVGHVKPDVTIAAARAEADRIIGNLGAADASMAMERGVSVAPIDAGVGAPARRALQLLFGSVIVVWLIACSNVVTLMLARGAARDHEFAIRRALGAGGGILVRQVLVEVMVLLSASAIVAFGAAHLAVRLLIAGGPREIPRLEQAAVDGRGFVFTLAVTLIAALLIVVVPAWSASRRPPSASLKSGGPRAGHSAGRTPSALVAVQFAFAVLLLVAAGLLLRTFVALESVELGFRPDHVITLRVVLPDRTPPARRLPLYERLPDRLRAVPGVEYVGGIAGLFESDPPPALGFRAVEGRIAEPRDRWTDLSWTTVSGDYFRAMGVRLVRGRTFAERDGAHTPLVAVVDESLAARYWPGEDPVGRRFKGQDARGVGDEWLTVIGVVEDMRRRGREHSPSPHVFEWHAQSRAATPDLVVRTSGDPTLLAPLLREALRAEEATAIISSMATMDAKLDEQLTARRFHVWLAGVFAITALVLACAGIYGVMHHSIGRRTQELGIRLALGATPAHVMRTVLAQGLGVAACGLAVGIVASWWMTRLFVGLLFGVTATDPLTFASAAAILMAVALAAVAVPAWRAAHVDPMLALRE